MIALVEKIAATIICYHPDMASVSRLVAVIAPEVETIIVHNNGGADSRALQDLHKKVEVTCAHKNLGIATPLNLAVSRAQERGCRFIVAFDQDSTPKPGMLTELKKALTTYQDIDSSAIAIGPTLVDNRNGSHKKAPFPLLLRRKTKIETTEVLVVSHLITSGSMIDLSKWNNRITFKEELFIDLIDTQWCWNVCSKGYTILGAKQIEMIHELSDGIIDIKVASLNKYTPARRYYQVRNAIALSLTERMPLAQLLFLLKGLTLNVASAILTDPKKLSSTWHCAIGLAHGLQRRLGPLKS